ncbi:hypothetical protein FHS83_000782 [Rhizomicrobium palustre]|uniref:PEP-CTERM sorting domain-containing protein n=1 Tax=Rhizomicrobium palustre TaxID=189966 RepID=A0A846MVG0_9PROT|nr:hypothetical protein [Rhizomicrobium palustre]NIK87464.1 hypothetical protein [Rhizomicrobium palustre]
MKRVLLLGLMFAWLAAAASASVTTYYWQQSSMSTPGLYIHGHYSWVDGSAPVVANSSDDPANFGGLLSLEIDAPNMPAVTLADLVPACADSSACNFGLPFWNISVSGDNLTMFYVDALNANSYQVTPYYILAGSDETLPCFDSGACVSFGSWGVPAPASLPVLSASLLLLGLFRARSGRTRS